MNESKAAISDRIICDIFFLPNCNKWIVDIILDEELFERHTLEYKYSMGAARSWAEERVRYILKEWPTCQDQTLPSEPKLRRTITISNGRATVIESLCLTEI